jgi:hypothetical protein
MNHINNPILPHPQFTLYVLSAAPTGPKPNQKNQFSDVWQIFTFSAIPTMP